MLRSCARTQHALRATHGVQASVARRRSLLTLAIESSCDDTCVAILEKRDGPGRPSGWKGRAKLHFNKKITSDQRAFGGVSPVEALLGHQRNLATLVQKSMTALPVASDDTPVSATISSPDGRSVLKPDFISVTRGPGMRSNVSCGLDCAKGLATAWQIPLLGVHHMQAHALTPRLVHALENDSADAPKFPFLNLLISGGHTILVHSRNLTQHTILAESKDNAIGDCLDKCGRVILSPAQLSSADDTSYGKHLSAFAFPDSESFTAYPIPRGRSDEISKPVTKYGWTMHAPLRDTRDLAFSFSGLDAHVTRIVEKTPDMSDDERLLLARTALGTAFEHLASRTVIALDALKTLKSQREVNTLVVSGGVAANDFLRWYLRQFLDVRGYKNVKLVFPPVELCTDNAAMIAWTGMEMYEAGYRSGLGVTAVRKWSLDAGAEDGGLLGNGAYLARL
jgi:N6-L-threonylcarbamoyladenine synthase